MPLASALASAHLKGVEHRDIKPGNILVRANGDPVLRADYARTLQLLGVTRSDELGRDLVRLLP